MEVIDPGHTYRLAELDGGLPQVLYFVKREGPGYPGNVGHRSGTTLQEVMRALVDRMEYVHRQIPCWQTEYALDHLKESIYWLEVRAADRHGREVDFEIEGAVKGPCCPKCGHVGCKGNCHETT